jgi:hypothetical protein
MAESAQARKKAPATISIAVTNDGTAYSINPSNGTVADGGTVQFVCSQACWIWTFVGTTPTDVFVSETNDYVVCSAGYKNYFPLSVTDETITIVPTDPNSLQPDLKFPYLVKGTIKVSS